MGTESVSRQFRDHVGLKTEKGKEPTVEQPTLQTTATPKKRAAKKTAAKKTAKKSAK